MVRIYHRFDDCDLNWITSHWNIRRSRLDSCAKMKDLDILLNFKVGLSSFVQECTLLQSQNDSIFKEM